MKIVIGKPKFKFEFVFGFTYKGCIYLAKTGKLKECKEVNYSKHQKKRWILKYNIFGR
jgi:hypothetical protein